MLGALVMPTWEFLQSHPGTLDAAPGCPRYSSRGIDPRAQRTKRSASKSKSLLPRPKTASVDSARARVAAGASAGSSKRVARHSLRPTAALDPVLPQGVGCRVVAGRDCAAASAVPACARDEGDPPQRLRDEHASGTSRRGCGRIRATARPTIPTSTTGPGWRARWSAAGSTAFSSPTSSASTTCTAARPTRRCAMRCRCRSATRCCWCRPWRR